MTPLLPGRTTASMPVRDGKSLIAVEDLELAVHLEATPTGRDSWTVTVWAAGVEHDPETTRLALAVASTGTPVSSSIVTRTDVEAEDDEPDFPTPAGHQRALWRVLRKAMTHARAVADTAVLRSRIPDLHVDSLGGAYPFQADGTWCGYLFYFRFRYGTARLDVGQTAETRAALWSAEMPFEGRWGDSDLSVEEFTDLFCTLGDQLSRAPFVYEFAELSPTGQPAGSAKPWQGSGHNPAEGYAELISRVSRAREDGFDVNPRFNPTPLNTDTRVFPDTEPSFTVHPAV